MLFYFSATGNSKRTAEIIAERTGDRLVSISGALASGAFSYDASDDDRIGFVIPTYFYNPPKAVMRFVEGLEIAGCEGKYAYVVLTLGSSGSAALSDGTLLRRAPLAIDAVDSTGAGDTYIGSFAVALLEGKDLEASMDFATKASAYTCLSAGAQQAIAWRADLDAWDAPGPRQR